MRKSPNNGPVGLPNGPPQHGSTGPTVHFLDDLDPTDDNPFLREIQQGIK